MIEYYKRTLNQKKLNKINSFEVGCWVNVINPKDEEVEKLAIKHNLDYEMLAEGLDENELPRIDSDENNNLYFYVKTSFQNKNYLGTLLIVITSNLIMTISKNRIEEFESIFNQKIKFITTQRYKNLIKILTLIDENIQKNVVSVVKNVQIKRSTTHKLKEKDMEMLLGYEDFLNNLVSTYNYTALLYSKIIKKIKFYEEDKELLEDLIIETEEGLNLCKNSLKSIKNIRNNYSIILSNKLNQTIKILTIVTILINIPTVIAGIYGMNVWLPMQESRFAIIFVLFLMIIFVGLGIFALKKKDLL
jgi:magnesium transporter